MSENQISKILNRVIESAGLKIEDFENKELSISCVSEEESKAFKFLKSLSPPQKKMAILSDKAPRDIYSGQDNTVNRSTFFPPKGLPITKMNPRQKGWLTELVEVYSAKHRPQVVEQVTSRKPLLHPTETFFAWSGGLTPETGHYYRIQTPDFLFEYANTQNNDTNKRYFDNAWEELETLIGKNGDGRSSDGEFIQHQLGTSRVPNLIAELGVVTPFMDKKNGIGNMKEMKEKYFKGLRERQKSAMPDGTQSAFVTHEPFARGYRPNTWTGGQTKDPYFSGGSGAFDNEWQELEKLIAETGGDAESRARRDELIEKYETTATRIVDFFIQNKRKSCTDVRLSEKR